MTSTSTIGVIGAGWLGGTVGRALAQAGHAVTFSSRNTARLKPLLAGLEHARIAPVEEAARCEIVLLATPYSALEAYGKSLSAVLAGKIVIDATNPSATSREGQQAQMLGVAHLTRGYFPEARLVRCFSAVDASCVEQGHGYGNGAPLGVPLASDDPQALEIVAQLVRDTGCAPVITGDLASARAFQRGGAGFRANTGAQALIAHMGLGHEPRHEPRPEAQEARHV